MDVGASAKIAKGLVRDLPCLHPSPLHFPDLMSVSSQIKIKSSSLSTSYTPTGLLFADGTELLADVIIFTTGFDGNMRRAVGGFVGPEIEDQLEDFWGVDEEGELRGAWKFSGREFGPYLTTCIFA